MVSEEVIKVLDYLADEFGIAIDWTSENILPYIQDLVVRIKMYSITIDIIWFVVGIIAVVIGILLFRYVIKHDDDLDCDSTATLTCTGLILTISGLVLLFVFGSMLVRDIFIPEVSILKTLQGFKL